MGALKNLRQDSQIPLASSNTIGRAASVDLRVESRACSGTHARIWWSGGAWQVRDLGSRNGTFLNGTRLPPGQPGRLRLGDRVAFGDATDVWTLTEDAAPVAMARSGEQLRQAVDGVLVLPDADRIVAMVYASRPGKWVLEDEADVRAVTDRAAISVEGQAWVLLLPGPEEATLDASQVAPVLTPPQARFTVSSDEEFAQLTLRQGSTVTPLRARVFHYTLLALARARVEDQAEGATESGAGWRYADEVCAMLRIDRQTLNLHVCRARQQVQRSGTTGDIVERRPSTGQLRFGLSDIHIDRV